jgi:outer membrane immunogenic protein
MSGATLAADVATSAYKAAPVGYNWSGPYAGASLGYGWGRADTTLSATGFPFAPLTAHPRGVVGGIQFGYNWLSGSVVYGFETDFTLSGQRGSSAVNYLALGIPVTTTQDVRLDWFGTFRARVGVTMDTWLIYGTGGAAVASYSSNTGTSAMGVTIPVNASGTVPDRLGWTIGAGVEKAFSPNWTVGLKYLYVDLGKISQTTIVNIPATNSTTLRENIFTASVNYRL